MDVAAETRELAPSNSNIIAIQVFVRGTLFRERADLKFANAAMASAKHHIKGQKDR